MSSLKTGLNALLTPEESVLVLIDHQPFQFANLNSHEPTVIVNDPFSHLGKGGEVRIAPNEAVAMVSRAATVAFFRCRLGLNGCTQ